jgi:predicted nucleic acid-binding protein
MRSNGFQPVTLFALFRTQSLPWLTTSNRGSVSSTRPRSEYGGNPEGVQRADRVIEVGDGRTCTVVGALVDTNVLVYRYDGRFPHKQKKATEILRRGIAEDSVRIPHQAIVEFVAAVTRNIRGHVILDPNSALREAEEMLKQFKVLYPEEAMLRHAIRGCAAYQLNWFDAHLWSYAEHFGLEEILSEDLQHDRHYGTVRVVNPFLA